MASIARFRGELKELPSSCGGSLAVSLTVSRSGGRGPGALAQQQRRFNQFSIIQFYDSNLILHLHFHFNYRSETELGAFLDCLSNEIRLPKVLDYFIQLNVIVCPRVICFKKQFIFFPAECKHSRKREATFNHAGTNYERGSGG